MKRNSSHYCSSLFFVAAILLLEYFPNVISTDVSRHIRSNKKNGKVDLIDNSDIGMNIDVDIHTIGDVKRISSLLRQHHERSVQKRRALSSFSTLTNTHFSDEEMLRVLRNFRTSYELLEDADIDFQTIGDDQYDRNKNKKNFIIVDSKKYPLDTLTPITDVLASTATHRLNGAETPFDLSWFHEPLTFKGKVTGDNNDGEGITTIVVQRNPKGPERSSIEIQTIDILTPDGVNHYLAAIAPGIVATITPSMRKRPVTLINVPASNVTTLEANSDKSLENEKDYYERKQRRLRITNKVLLSSKMSTKSHQRKLLQWDLECSSYYIIQLAVAYDSTFCINEGGGNAMEAERVLRAIIEKASTMYEGQGVCTKLKIVHVEGYCIPTTDQFKAGVSLRNIGCSKGGNGTVQFFKTWINENPPPSPHDAYHLFIHDENFPKNHYGCATQDSICHNAHGVTNNVFGTEIFRKAALFAHELGHNLGLHHVQDTGLPDYIMEDVGFTEHKWSEASLDAFAEKLITYDCLDNVAVPKNDMPLVPGKKMRSGTGSINIALESRTDTLVTTAPTVSPVTMAPTSTLAITATTKQVTGSIRPWSISMIRKEMNAGQ